MADRHHQATNDNTTTTAAASYYDILEVPETASALDIKKAYRRLALLYHPDRNRNRNRNNSNSNSNSNSTQRFQQVGEAYQCLSDVNQRRRYDQELLFVQRRAEQAAAAAAGPTRTSNTSSKSTTSYNNPHRYHSPSSPHFNAWTQFDTLFHNDPFFRDFDSSSLFESDEAIQREFANLKNLTSTEPTSPAELRRNHPQQEQSVAASRQQQQPQPPPKMKEGWFPWLLRQCGISFTMTSVVVQQDPSGNGNSMVRASRIQSTNRNNNNNNNSSSNHTVQQETTSYIDSTTGQRVWIRCRQYHGQQIQEKLIQDGPGGPGGGGLTVVERRVNGVVVDEDFLAAPGGNATTSGSTATPTTT